MRRKLHGFTLIEMMIVVAIIAVLLTIGTQKWAGMTNKAKEGASHGAQGTLRSALAIYYGDNEKEYPTDNLSCLLIGGRYIPLIPAAQFAPMHEANAVVRAETAVTDSGGWSYNNDPDDQNWGHLLAGCDHADSRGNVWSSY